MGVYILCEGLGSGLGNELVICFVCVCGQVRYICVVGGLQEGYVVYGGPTGRWCVRGLTVCS